MEYCLEFKKIKPRQQDSWSGIYCSVLKKMRFRQQDSGSGIYCSEIKKMKFHQQDSGSGILFGIQENEASSAGFWGWNIVRYSRK